MKADEERFSQLSGLVGWAVWMLWTQQLGKEDRLKWGSFSDWARYFRPPGWIVPEAEGEE